jgi:hypothetical protein
MNPAQAKEGGGMEYKPSDLFVGVIDFFGILVPGAVLVFLHGDQIFDLLGMHRAPDDKIFYWTSFVIVSFLLGHFLTSLGVLLLNWVYGLPIGSLDRYYKEAEPEISLAEPKTRKDAFHRAYAFIRLNCPAGISEIDRQVAEYKLFRALTIVFLIDFGFALAANDARHMVVSAVLVLLSGHRFASLVSWTQRITFEYYVLLTRANKKVAATTETTRAPGS